MRFYAFIINPVAGNGKSINVWGELKAILDDNGISYRSFLTEYRGHAEEVTKQIISLYREKVKAIVVVGGDGTLHEVINGMSVMSRIPVGYIPAGSGNDFARGVALRKEPVEALQSILRADGIIPFDIGDYSLGESKKRSRCFVNSIGAGFDAEVSRAADESKYKKVLNKLRLGRLTYVFAIMEKLFTYKPSDMIVIADGKKETHKKVWLATVANTPFFGGGMKIAPDADPYDGRLNVCIVKGIPRWMILLLFVTVFFGLHKYIKGVELFEAKSLQIESDVPLPIQADGEFEGFSPCKIQVKEKERNLLFMRSGKDK